MPHAPNRDRIEPSRRSVMRLADTDPDKDPWTGAARQTGRNLADEAPLDENVALLPPLGKTPAQLGAELQRRETENIEALVARQLEQERAQADARPQFSLRQLLLLMTAASIGLAGVRLLPPGLFALAAGGLALLLLWLTTQYEIKQRWVHALGLAALSIYAASFVAAVVKAWWWSG